MAARLQNIVRPLPSLRSNDGARPSRDHQREPCNSPSPDPVCACSKPRLRSSRTVVESPRGMSCWIAQRRSRDQSQSIRHAQPRAHLSWVPRPFHSAPHHRVTTRRKWCYPHAIPSTTGTSSQPASLSAIEVPWVSLLCSRFSSQLTCKQANGCPGLAGNRSLSWAYSSR